MAQRAAPEAALRFFESLSLAGGTLSRRTLVRLSIKDAVMIESIVVCLALTAYHEARGEAEAGQRAVMQVVLNRSKERKMKVCNVVTEKNQFSWTNGKKDPLSQVPKGEVWARIKMIAREEMTKCCPYNLQYFHHVKERPKWRHDFKRVIVLGNHIFYSKKS